MPSFLRILIKTICVLIVIGLLLAVSGVALFNYLNSPPDMLAFAAGEDSALRIEDGKILFLEIKSGESAISVGKRLESAGIIRNQNLWYLLSRLKQDFIKAGTYRIELPATQLSIHSTLVAGRQLLVSVTIPEGVTLKKIAALLEEANICGAEDFLAAALSPELAESYRIPGKTFEGYLFPDTYNFPMDFSPEQVIAAMVDTFFMRIGQIVPEALALSADELFGRVTLASIVEREYRVAEEAPLMAGVFYNRLRIGMALQSCATVEYIITEIQGRPHPEVLFNRDIEIRDPYNTYIQPGLPPGPISAPGATALLAAFYPAESDYLYFRLTDPAAGRHYFSRTLDDHIRAGALYVKGK